MYKHILIPTDGSELAAKAVASAIEFAREAGARVTLFTAVPEYRPPMEGEVMALRRLISIEEHERRSREKARGPAPRLRRDLHGFARPQEAFAPGARQPDHRRPDALGHPDAVVR